MSTLNINIGILGHVDSGKTSLAKLLSTVASTSSFDKNPQSKKRGITLDLGFSSFIVNSFDYAFSKSISDIYDKVQFTLVDCPGHGSLIRTVLCVVDINKGFQTQTSECLVISEITCSQIIVVLNKCDLLEPTKRGELIEKMKKRIIKTLEASKFKNSPISTITAAPCGTQIDFNLHSLHSNDSVDVQNLIQLLAKSIVDPTQKRLKLKDENFLFAVDHCFAVTGQGTVLTGTVLAGSIMVNQTLELPYQRIQKKIKSIQMFRKPIDSIGPGDRAGICVAQLDPTLLERGLVGLANNNKKSLIPCHACLLGNVRKIAYFKSNLTSKSRLHIFVGQETVLAKLTFVRNVNLDKLNNDGNATTSSSSSSSSSLEFDLSGSYEYVDQLENELGVCALIEFERPVVCPLRSLVIGSKLDNYSITSCRLALYGHIVFQLTDANYSKTVLNKLMVFRRKTRRGQIERVVNSRTCIVRGLFKRETNWEIFIGLKSYIILNTENGIQRIDGYIESSFGQSGKCRLVLNDDLPAELVERFGPKSGKISNDDDEVSVVLEFKRHVFDSERRIIQ